MIEKNTALEINQFYFFKLSEKFVEKLWGLKVFMKSVAKGKAVLP